MNPISHKHLFSAVALAALAACGGGGGSTTTTANSTSVPMVISDASSEDWSTIGVQLTALTLTRADGSTTDVPLGADAIPINLAQLDQLGEVLGNAHLTAGDIYTGATLTVRGNPGDVTLVSSADPEPGFPVAPGTEIPAAQIQIQHARGATGSKTVTIPVRFEQPLVVPADPGTALDIEVDLSHPTLIVDHTRVGDSVPTFAVNFNGPVKHRPVRDITRLVLRHMYGTLESVSADNTSLTLTKAMPHLPVTSPETAVPTTQLVTVQADAAHGTLVYDLDAHTTRVATDFSSVSAALSSGRYVRVAARYQQDGSLVATRIWTAHDFSTVWLSTEGHVLHVDTAQSTVVVANESGRPVSMQVDAGTQFFFRAAASVLSDTTPIGTGPAFLASHNLVRGFKVHAQVVDPLATPLVAKSIDIETAGYEGKVSNATTSSFVVSHAFATATDDYSIGLPYIAGTSANGRDSGGQPILGFKFWNFAFPTLVDSGPTAVSDFVSTVAGSVDFGGTAGALVPRAAAWARWGDPANTTGWASGNAVLLPTPVPHTTVATGLANNAFSVNARGGTKPVTVGISTAVGSATLAYQVDRSGGVITVSAQDLTTAAGLAALSGGLVSGATVKVSAVPQGDGTLKAYVVTYFTGEQPK